MPQMTSSLPLPLPLQLSLLRHPAIVLYTTLNLLAAAALLRATLSSRHHEATSRAALHLLTTILILPATLTPPPHTAPARRTPVLATFIIALTLLIDAVLRLLPSLQALFHSLPPHPLTHNRPALAFHAALHAFFLLATPRRPSMSKLPVATPHSSAPVPALRLHAKARLAAAVADAVSAHILTGSAAAALQTVVATLTAHAAVPALAHAARVLMQAAPGAVVASIRDGREAVLAIDGVLECGNVHIWEEAAGVLVGTLCVTVDAKVCKSSVLHSAVAAFDGIVDDLTVQVESWRPTSTPRPGE